MIKCMKQGCDLKAKWINNILYHICVRCGKRIKYGWVKFYDRR